MLMRDRVPTACVYCRRSVSTQLVHLGPKARCRMQVCAVAWTELTRTFFAEIAYDMRPGTTHSSDALLLSCSART